MKWRVNDDSTNISLYRTDNRHSADQHDPDCTVGYVEKIGGRVMSVLIKGMKMPKKCGLCDLFHAESPMHCTVVKGYKTVGAPYGMPRPEWCPLVALPDKHGDLIDRDELRAEFPEPIDIIDPQQALVHITGVWAEIDCADVVIEAEEEA